MYDGFISYSHAADDLLAPRLQAGLQRFAKPWWKRRAVRIFRDESSLAANPHLWSSIVEALDSSDWFVLLLSEDAASSKWVGKEIEHWVQHRDASRILPVVTDGTFSWDDDVQGSAVPEALKGVFAEEPRWVDLRFARDEDQLDLQNPEFSNAVADVASAIRGVPKDELASEEVRQHRRTVRTAWSAGAIIGILAIAATVFAFQASTERERAEEEATRANQEADRAEANAEAEAEARAEAERNAQLANQNERLAESRELAASSIALVDSDPALATWLALLAIDQTPDQTEHPVEVVNALWRSVSANPLSNSIQAGPPGNTFLDLSPDGLHVAVSSSEAATVKLFTAEALEALWTYSEVTEDGFSKPEFSPDGRLIAVPVVGSGAEFPWRDGGEDDLPNRVVILETATGSVSTTLEFPDCETIDAATWSPEGDLLAVGTGPGGCALPDLLGDTWVEVFETGSWSSVALLHWEEDDLAVRPLFVGPDRLGAFPTHSSPRIYETESFSLVDLLEETGATVPAAVSAQSGLIGIFSNDVLISRVHDLATGEQVDILGELEAWPAAPFGLSFSPDGRLLMSATAGPILIWDVESGEQVFRLAGGAGATNADFSPDSSQVYSAHLDGTVKVWDLTPGGAAVATFENIESAKFINGNTFSVGSEVGAFERIEFDPFARYVQFFSAADGSFVAPPLLHVGGPGRALDNDEFLIATGDEEWQWQLYDPISQTSADVESPCPADQCFGYVSQSRDEIGIARPSDDETWEWNIYDANTLDLNGTFGGTGEPVGFGGTWVLERFGEQGGAFFFTDRSTQEELLRIPIPPNHFEASNTGSAVALSGTEGPIYLVDTERWDTAVLDLGIGRRRGMSFSPSGALLAVADEDEILFVDLEMREIVQEFPIPVVSDIHWINESEIVIGDRHGLWARLSLEFDDLIGRALDSLEVRPLSEQECLTYRIDPCPTLDELREG